MAPQAVNLTAGQSNLRVCGSPMFWDKLSKGIYFLLIYKRENAADNLPV